MNLHDLAQQRDGDRIAARWNRENKEFGWNYRYLYGTRFEVTTAHGTMEFTQSEDEFRHSLHLNKMETPR